ncbi:MAG TPA: TetR/AcrR family transcriptional regulator C-terminal domain-containing protein [Acidimicrobiia bacterium]
MATETEPRNASRIPLSKERVLRAAVQLADRAGLEALTMRNLAHEVGVEAMSLYYHVANKEAVLDGVVDVIVNEINQVVYSIDGPSPAGDWKTAMRMRILAAREVMLAHPWAPEVIEQRTNMSPAILLYFEGLLGIFREGGFSYDLAHHAMHALGSKALGFSQELFNPGNEEPGQSDEMLEQFAEQLPYLSGMLMEIGHDDPDSTLGWCDDQTEFEFSLDLLLDGLDRLLGAV